MESNVNLPKSIAIKPQVTAGGIQSIADMIADEEPGAAEDASNRTIGSALNDAFGSFGKASAPEPKMRVPDAPAFAVAKPLLVESGDADEDGATAGEDAELRKAAAAAKAAGAPSEGKRALKARREQRAAEARARSGDGAAAAAGAGTLSS